MRALLFFVTCGLLLLAGAASAQTSLEHIDTIKVVKKQVSRPLPDTGRYKSPAGYVPDGAIRWEEWRCGYKPRRGALFAGAQYFKYTFLQVGVEKINDRFPTITGISFEGNADKNVYGASVFARQPVCHPLGMTVSPGVSASVYSTPGNMLYVATPYVSFNFPYRCLTGVNLSYGYNLLIEAKDATNEANESLKGMNMHFIELTWHFPFY